MACECHIILKMPCKSKKKVGLLAHYGNLLEVILAPFLVSLLYFILFYNFSLFLFFLPLEMPKFLHFPKPVSIRLTLLLIDPNPATSSGFPQTSTAPHLLP